MQRLEAAGADHARQARDDAAGLGDDGPDARPADRAATRTTPTRVPGGSSSGSAVAVATGHRRPRAGHRRRRQRAPSRRGLRRRRLQADLRLGAARRLHAVRAELRHRRRDRAHASPRPRCSTRCSADTPPAELARRPRRPARRVPRRLLHGRARGRRRGACSSARAGACARVRSTSRGRRTTTARWAPIFTAEPGAFVLEHDPQPDPDALRRRRRSPTSRPSRCAAGDRLPARPPRRWPTRSGAARPRPRATTSCSAPRRPCAPVPIDGPDKTTRMNALTKPFNALGWPAAVTARGPRSRRPAARPAGRRPARAATRSCCAPPPRSSALRFSALTLVALLSARRAHAQHRREAALDVVVRRRPRRHADAHRRAALPDRAAAPARAVGLHGRRSRARVSAGSPNETSTWLSTTSLRIS